MKVLMISFDHTICPQNVDIAGDTRDRHIRYASALRALYPDGHITVIVKAPPGYSSQAQTLSEGISVYPIPCRRWAFLLKAWAVIGELAKKVQFDLVTTQTPFDDGLLGLWVKRRFGIPLNVQMRSSFLDLKPWIQERPIIYRIFNEIGKWVSHRADSIRVVCNGEQKRLELLFPKLQGKIFALHPLVNVDTFNKPLHQKQVRHVRRFLKQYGKEDMPFVLFVGRLVLQKNLTSLFNAFALVQKNIPAVTLVIAGDGHLRKELEVLVKQLGLDGNILWLGNLSLEALQGWYALARGTLLLSFHEGLPKVVVESYLRETPVVATPFVSANELIRTGETGFVTASFSSITELAQNVSALLLDEEKSKEMGEKGKRHVMRYLLSEEQYMNRLIEIWRNTSQM